MLRNFQGRLSVIGLGNEQIFDIHPEAFGVVLVKGMFGINECGNATGFLRFGYGMNGQGRFSGGFGAVYLNDTSAGQAAYAQGNVEGQRSAGNHRHISNGFVAQLHDRPFSILFLQLVNRQLKCFQFILIRCCHNFPLMNNCQ